MVLSVPLSFLLEFPSYLLKNLMVAAAYVDYRDLNNLTIKIWYPLILIGKSLNPLDWAKQFTQIDLTNAYHQIKIKEGDK